MERPNPYKRRLDKLECHFLWLCDKDGKVDVESVEVIIQNTELCMEQSPSLRRPALGLLSYLYTLNSTKTDLNVALDNICSAKEISEDASADFVLRANELHLKDLFDGEHDGDALTRLEQEWHKRESHPKWEAAVWGAKGYAMSRFGPSKLEVGKESFEKAINLDPKDDYWKFGKAILLERQRRLYTGLQGKPSEEELTLLKTANVLTENKNAQYTAYYGHALAEAGKARKECLQVLTSGMQFAGDDQLIYWKAAKIYKRFGMRNEQKECLLDGIKCCKIKDRLYHALGNMFWRNRDSTLDDLPTARGYLEKCIKEPGQEYYWQEMDLLSIEIQMDPKLDPLRKYHQLGTKYRYSNVFMINLHKQKGHYFLEKDKADRAIKEFLTAVGLESSQVHMHGHVSSVRPLIERCLKQRIIEGSLEEIQEMKNLAWFYQECKPETREYLEMSVIWYKQVIDLMPFDWFAISNLGQVLIDLANYEETVEKKLAYYEKAIDVLDQRSSTRENGDAEDRVIVSKLAAKARYNAAVLTDCNYIKEKHFRRCMALRCKSGAYGLLGMLTDRAKVDPKFRYSSAVFIDCTLISSTINNSCAFCLEPNIPEIHEIENEIKKLLDYDIEGRLQPLRELRYEMSLNPDRIETKIEPVLTLARSELDRIHRQMVDKNFPKEADPRKKKQNCYFPRVLGLDDTNTDDEWKKALSNLVESPKQEHGGCLNFSHRFDRLLSFLTKKQKDSHLFLGKWFGMMILYKHNRALDLSDYQIEEIPTNIIPHEFAHAAVEFTEEVVAEYEQYM